MPTVIIFNPIIILVSADTEIPWSIDKFDAQDGPSADNNEPTRKLLNAEFDER